MTTKVRGIKISWHFQDVKDTIYVKKIINDKPESRLKTKVAGGDLQRLKIQPKT